MDLLQLLHFTTFDPGALFTFFLQSLVLQAKKTFAPAFKISGQQTQFTSLLSFLLVTSWASASVTVVDFDVLKRKQLALQ